ncbi:putative ankyrin repeat protein [Smittium mucronatum]|uniref:Putative ankyrin repeat protein n=1 Tax=Smittium mucronatum TaxID=133383 RepID=A0A1R0GQP2_9FUNG|nr:putative ankyrin repeat protein [Smittium mucronatum]OLY81080.1 putative ankyrin repeat protein [Smittium mucronatum]
MTALLRKFLPLKKAPVYKTRESIESKMEFSKIGNSNKIPLVDINANNGKALKLAISISNTEALYILFNAFKINPTIEDSDNGMIQITKHPKLDLGLIDDFLILEMAKRKEPGSLEFLFNFPEFESTIYTIFIESIKLHNSPMSKFMIERGVDISLYENFALMCCAWYENLSVMELLFLKGADLSDQNGKALSIACSKGYDTIACFLIKNGADPGLDDGISLVYASISCSFKTIKLLCENGADVDSHGEVALAYACERSNYRIANYLISLGIDVNLHEGYPLIIACRNNSIRLVKLLVFCGADVNAQNGRPLIEAARVGCFDIVDFLLSRGADPNANNKLALDIAKRKGQLDIIKNIYDSIQGSSHSDHHEESPNFNDLDFFYF